MRATDKIETADIQLQAARLALAEGKPLLAQSFIDAVDAENISDRLTYDFTRARILMALGKYRSAVPILTNLVNRYPTLTRIRLELARCFFEIGDNENARSQFELAAAKTIDPAVQYNIQRYLTLLQTRQHWHGSFMFSISEESNVSRGTSSRVIIINGLPFTLSDDAREESGRGINYFATLSYRRPLSEHYGVNIASRLWLNDFPGRNFDDSTLEFFPALRRNLKRGEIDFGPIALFRWNRGHSLGTDSGVRIAAYLRWASQWITDGEVTALRHDLSHRYNDIYEGQSLRARLRLRYLLSSSAWLGASASGADNDAQRDWLDYESHGKSGEAYMEVPFGVTFLLRHRLTTTHYDAPHPFFGRNRKDETRFTSLTIGLRKFAIRQLYPSFILSSERRNSNFTVNRFENESLSFSLSQTF